MIKQLKIFITAVFITIFSAQVVMACGCDVDFGDVNAHSNHNMLTHEMSDTSTHDCKNNCEMAFTNNADDDFIFFTNDKVKSEKKVKQLNYAQAQYKIVNFKRGPPDRTFKKYTSNKHFLKITLYAQGILLRV